MIPPSKISVKSTTFDVRLARCLGIRDLAAFGGFTEEVWEKRPAIWTAESFPVRLDLKGVESLFHEQLFREADVRLVKGGQDALTPGLYLDQRGFVRAAQVWSELPGGATLVIRQFDKHHAPTGGLCRELEMIFHQPVVANLYVTPQSRQGLPLHQDYHDVIVCQLDGEKRWEVHECREIPTEAAPTFPRNPGDAGEILLRHTLVPGEIMYAPRGSHHRAIAGQGGSVHVTLGVHAKKWADFFAETVKQLLETDERFRRSLPLGFLDPAWQAQEDPSWPHLLETLRGASPQPALDDLRRRLLKWCGPAPLQTPEVADEPTGEPSWERAFGADSTLVRTGLAHLDGETAGGPLLHLPGLVLNVTAEDAPFARWLTGQPRIRAGEIPFAANTARLSLLNQFLRLRVYQPGVKSE